MYILQVRRFKWAGQGSGKFFVQTGGGMQGPGTPGPRLYGRRLLIFMLRAAHVRPPTIEANEASQKFPLDFKTYLCYK